jgi:hypothetical protein
MGRLALEVPENPPKLPKMSDIVVHAATPPRPRPPDRERARM